jgi:carboxylesterase
MTLAVLATVVVALLLSWRPLRRARWQAAERSIAQRLTLGGDGVVRGAQPIDGGDSPRAALLLHGFGDTPQSLAHLAQRLIDAGWTVSVPLLPGHGRTLAAFHASSAVEWMRHAEAEFDTLAERYTCVVVCGQSMGAALALELAATRNVRAIALLAPYVAVPRGVRAAAKVWPLIQALRPVLPTRDARSIHDPHARAQSLAYGYTTARLLAELATIVRCARGRLADVHVPTLIVHSREDNRIPAAEVQRAAARIDYPVKALHWVSGCGHVVAADYCGDAVATLVVDWFERVSATHDAAHVAR